MFNVGEQQAIREMIHSCLAEERQALIDMLKAYADESIGSLGDEAGRSVDEKITQYADERMQQLTQELTGQLRNIAKDQITAEQREEMKQEVLEQFRESVKPSWTERLQSSFTNILLVVAAGALGYSTWATFESQSQRNQQLQQSERMLEELLEASDPEKIWGAINDLQGRLPAK